MSDTDADALNALSYRLSTDPKRWPDRHGRYHANCPFCGKEAKSGQDHFAIFFGSKRQRWAYHCFPCNASGSLRGLLKHLDMEPTLREPKKIQQAPQDNKPRRWQTYAEQTVAGLCRHPRRVELWQQYKPLTPETIRRWRLGVGVLPSSRCEVSRLIVPIYAKDKLIALHGRAYLPDDPFNNKKGKWLTSKGSDKEVLFNGDLLTPGCVAVVSENFIDSLLAMQLDPRCIGVASGGVSWNETLVEQLAAARPSMVLVWTDNDEAGLLVGGEIANQLMGLGIRAQRYRWQRNAPLHADLGWAVQQAIG